MKFNDFQSLIKDKDIKNEDVQKEVFNSINNEINNIVKSKQDKLDEINAQAQESKKSLDELNKQLQSTIAANSQLKNQNYIVRKVNQNLDDESIDDIITLASKRVNENTTMEQAIDQVASKFFSMKKEEKQIISEPTQDIAKTTVATQPKVRQSYVSPVGVISSPKTAPKENPFLEALGIGHKKRGQKLYKQIGE